MYKIAYNGYVEINDNYPVTAVTPGLIYFVAPNIQNVPVILLNSWCNGGTQVVQFVDPDGYGPVIIPSQEQFGILVVNFTSNASINLTGNQQLWGTIQMTDTTPNLSGAVNVVFPYMISGYKRTVINSTAQTLTFEGTHGTGVAVAAGKTSTIRCDGFNWLRVTADV
jgi:hypothetical protein